LVEERSTPPFLLVLDGVTDPHNLGAVLRSALGAGVTGIVLPKHRSAHVTPTVAKAAAGAIEHLEIALVPGIPSALERLSRLKVWSVGLAADGDADLDDVQVLTEPVALVLGAEGAGLSSLTRARCDVVARIELTGPVESLNVSAAGAVACFAVSRARRA
jgi:23S rRNA (guanosine2251-2'-O)-methyltransferase